VLEYKIIMCNLPPCRRLPDGVKSDVCLFADDTKMFRNIADGEDKEILQDDLELKKWWVESDFKAPNLPLSLRLKVSGCHYNSIYNNT
jgi:hypothetical protein